MQHLLFVYGTLLLADNDLAGHLRQHSCFVAHGKINGLLYDVGEYPALIIELPTDTWVYGSINKINDEALKIIDDYEGFGPGQDEPYLYLREMKDIETNNGILQAWVYIYNHDKDQLPLIISGNYMEYLEQKKSRDA